MDSLQWEEDTTRTSTKEHGATVAFIGCVPVKISLAVGLHSGFQGNQEQSMHDRVSTLLPTLDCSGTIGAHCSLDILGSSDPPTSASLAAETTVSFCSPGWSALVQSWLNATATFQVQAILVSQPPKGVVSSMLPKLVSSNLPASASPSLEITETGFHHVGQAALELPASGDPPASASHTAGITGMSHRARPSWSPFKLVPMPGTVAHVCNSSTLRSQGEKRQGLALLHRLECSGMILAHFSLELLGSSNPPASAPSTRTTGVHHHNQLIFQFFRQGSCYATQAALKLLGSSNLPTSASQSAKITDRVLPYTSGWSAAAQSQLNATYTSWVQPILLPQPPKQMELQEFKATMGNIAKPLLYKKYKNQPGMMAHICCPGALGDRSLSTRPSAPGAHFTSATSEALSYTSPTPGSEGQLESGIQTGRGRQERTSRRARDADEAGSSRKEKSNPGWDREARSRGQKRNESCGADGLASGRGRRAQLTVGRRSSAMRDGEGNSASPAQGGTRTEKGGHQRTR
ncbi:LOW QUALITY PROTEIN: hypothetical protein AAY473_027413 [Plecturocebus cupreus]